MSPSVASANFTDFPDGVQPPRRLNTEQAAEWLCLPSATLRWYRHKGDRGPKSYVLGSRVMYDMTELISWEAGQKAETERGGPR